MKLLVIGHPDAVLGFSLVGVDGMVARDEDQTNHALDQALATPNVGIILVTEDVAELIDERMTHLRMHSTVPLVVEIPAPEGMRPERPSLREIVMSAIGVKI